VVTGQRLNASAMAFASVYMVQNLINLMKTSFHGDHRFPKTSVTAHSVTAQNITVKAASLTSEQKQIS
jgi:hypothetical protein